MEPARDTLKRGPMKNVLSHQRDVLLTEFRKRPRGFGTLEATAEEKQNGNAGKNGAVEPENAAVELGNVAAEEKDIK